LQKRPFSQASIGPKFTGQVKVAMVWRACSNDSNQFSSRHSSRKEPLKLSMYAFWVGLPGSIRICLMPCFCVHVINARHANSGPLSVLTSLGYACKQPGVSRAAKALANGLNANLLRRWIRKSAVTLSFFVSRD